MTLQIPQSTTFLCVFKAYLASDHVTEATGKTIAITISKNGATSFSNPNAGATNATEMASGWYKVSLDTTDTNTVGPLAIRGAVATIDDVGVLVYVVKATNGGLTALPDTACTTNASLVTAGTGTSQISVSSGQVILQTGTGTGQLDFTSGIVKANVTQNAGSAITSAAGIQEVKVASIAANAITATSIAADAITAAKVADGTIDAATFATGAITADAIAADAIGSSELAATAANEIADAILDRDMSTGADSGSTTVRTPRQALRFLRNKWDISAGTLTVRKEDDSTASWTSSVSTDAAAEPVIGNDPAGP